MRDEVFGHRNRLGAVLRFAGHFEVVFEFEHLAKRLAHDHVVFRQQNSNSFHQSIYLAAVAIGGRGISTSITVPVPRTDLILKVPPT